MPSLFRKSINSFEPLIFLILQPCKKCYCFVSFRDPQNKDLRIHINCGAKITIENANLFRG